MMGQIFNVSYRKVSCGTFIKNTGFREKGCKTGNFEFFSRCLTEFKELPVIIVYNVVSVVYFIGERNTKLGETLLECPSFGFSKVKESIISIA